MSRVMIDDHLRAKLNGLDQDIELCDEAGTPLGHFVPQEEYLHMLIVMAEAQCPIPPEEWERRRRLAGKGNPLADIWNRLGVQ